jgi:poly(3-hydroxybutyrate) depolymerase
MKSGKIRLGSGACRPTVSNHFHEVDTCYFGFDKIKDGIVRTVYNDRDFDLPELQLVDTRSVASRSKPGDRGIDQHLELTWQGRKRDYNLHIPPGYDGSKPMPLVVVMHGWGQDAERIAEVSGMSEKADREGFIVAYPNATKWFGVNGLRAWDVDNGITPPGTDSDDVDFISNMKQDNIS